MLLFIVIPLAGLTALESLLVGDASAKAKGREMDSSYQTQSELNNLVTAITTGVVWIDNEVKRQLSPYDWSYFYF